MAINLEYGTLVISTVDQRLTTSHVCMALTNVNASDMRITDIDFGVFPLSQNYVDNPYYFAEDYVGYTRL